MTAGKIRFTGSASTLGEARIAHKFDTLSSDSRVEDIISTITGMQIGQRALLLTGAAYPTLQDQSYRASFIPDEDLEKGRSENSHGVKFGQLILNGPGVYEMPDLIAIKPASLEEITAEITASAYLNSLFDYQSAFLNLGVAVDERQRKALVSLYEHGVKSADNIFWVDKDITPEALRAETVQRTAQLCMFGLGILHGSRVIHHDAEAKNLAFDRNIRFIDLEDSEIIDPSDMKDDQVLDKAFKDIATFIDSMVQVDENRDQIVDALKSPAAKKHLIAKYKQGVAYAKRFQKRGTIPDIGTAIEDRVQEYLTKKL